MAKILLIDDDPRTQALVSEILVGQGHEVATADGGEVGVAAALSDHGYDLVVTDLNMRGVNGWEAVRRIRAEIPAIRLPILALSAFTTAADRDEAFDAGCNAYANKPVAAADLLRRVQELIG
jgi:CheY-like chemotaxis protein